MQPLAPVVSILGRLCLCTIFIMSAVGNKIPQFNGVVGYMKANGMTLMPEAMLVGAIIFLLVGSAMVVSGYQARFGAFLLLIFLLLATFFFHDFWNPRHGDQAQMQMIQAMKNLGLMGAMLFIMANGSGAGSLDRVLGKSAKAKEPLYT